MPFAEELETIVIQIKNNWGRVWPIPGATIKTNGGDICNYTKINSHNSNFSGTSKFSGTLTEEMYKNQQYRKIFIILNGEKIRGRGDVKISRDRKEFKHC